MKYLGKLLTDNASITTEELHYALQLQQNHGGKLGDNLLASSTLNHKQLYQSLAKQQKVDYADLKKSPPLYHLINHQHISFYAKFHTIPWKQLPNGSFIFATTSISEELQQWARQCYGHVSFVLTSPLDIQHCLQHFFGSTYLQYATEQLALDAPQYSAKRPMSSILLVHIIQWLLFLLLGALLLPIALYTAFCIGINLLYLIVLLLKVVTFLVGIQTRCSSYSHTLATIDSKLPIYTILIPLYQEAAMIPSLIRGIQQLDYPPAKLDIKLIVEADDYLTQDAIRQCKCPRSFDMIIVPPSHPQTKPKALNYALQFAKGSFVTVFDAEDIPHPKQLKEALAAFEDAKDPKLACVQAQLAFYNRQHNLLTRLFTFEYAMQFDYLLWGMQTLQLPLLLGGTSNHFRLSALKQCGAWDPYNVTEDADIGIRLIRHGYRLKMLNSYTHEEAPSTIGNWLRQRSRWIKGFMQTYLVHMRHPKMLYKTLNLKGFIAFQCYVGAPAVIFLLAPFMWLTWCIQWVVPTIFPSWLLWVGLANLSLCLLYHIGVAYYIQQRKQWSNSFTVLCFPFYWVLHSIASFKSLWQLFTKPHFWEKTMHGAFQSTQKET